MWLLSSEIVWAVVLDAANTRVTGAVEWIYEVWEVYLIDDSAAAVSFILLFY